MQHFDTINPANGEKLAEYPLMDNATVENVLDAVTQAQHAWRKQPFEHRAQCFRKAAEILRTKAGEFGELMMREMGKPLAQGKAEAEKCALGCDFYADNAQEFLSRQPIKTDASNSFVCFEPLGVVLAIMPWNYPFWQVMRFVGPTLSAGNGGLLKHSPNVTGCALALEQLFVDAGFPPNLFRTLVIDTDQAADVIADSRVHAVSLTGSVGAGRAVAAEAGKALKKCVLELGGSDAYVVLEDADLDLAAKVCVKGRLTNSGQSCIAAKRFIVTQSVSKEFEAEVTKLLRDEVQGDPADAATTIGPMARPDLRDGLHKQVQRSIEKGARLVMGGELPEGPGYYYPVTLLADIGPGMAAYEEEFFGPVAVIIPAKDDDDAVRIANDSVFGLGGAVFTRDSARGEKLAAEALHSGAVFVNSQCKSDPRMPFGGIKNSGYGRELSAWGIHEFVNIKSVSVA